MKPDQVTEDEPLNRRIDAAMRALGWIKFDKPTVCKRGGKPEWGYYRPLPHPDEPGRTPTG
jgi:hypothetical protein